MSFCVPFDSDFKYIDEVQELLIHYTSHSKRDSLEAFLESYSLNHRIIIHFSNINDIPIEFLAMIKFTHPDFNFILAVDNYTIQINELLSKSKLPYYFTKVISDIDQFNGFLNLNVTDIIIGENLCFHLEDLSKLAKNKNKNLRTFVNVAQTTWANKESSITDFFIRPDDIDIYSQYIDTFEFWSPEGRINVLYEIYAKDKYWYGLLNEIITGYKGTEHNACLIDLFAKRRLNCGKQCAYGKSCLWCYKMQELAKTLEKKQFMIRHSKE